MSESDVQVTEKETWRVEEEKKLVIGWLRRKLIWFARSQSIWLLFTENFQEKEANYQRVQHSNEFSIVRHEGLPCWRRNRNAQSNERRWRRDHTRLLWESKTNDWVPCGMLFRSRTSMDYTQAEVSVVNNSWIIWYLWLFGWLNIF